MAILKSNVVTLEAAGTMVDKNFADNNSRVALYTSAGAISLNDVILMFKIPVDAVIKSLKLNATDSGTGGLIDVGFYKAIGEATPTAVDAAAIGTDIDIKTAAVSNSEIRFETKAITTACQKAWELAGLSARPAYDEFYVAVKIKEATTAAGTIVLTADIIS
jgi:hypothetical protein